jgi:tetratricopeptide (TPR) repeat protein
VQVILSLFGRFCSVVTCSLVLLLFPVVVIALPPPADNSAAPDSSIQVNPEKSLEQLQKTFNLFPYNEVVKRDLATAYSAKGQRQLMQKKFDEAADSFEHARTLFPDYQDFGIMIGVALYLGKRYDEAAYELERSRLTGGDNVQLLVYLGRVRYDTGDLAAALDVWERALVLDPVNKGLLDLVGKARRESAVESRMGKGYRSMFVISYDEGTMSDLADSVLKSLEEAYNRVGSDLSYYPSVRVPVILYTRKDYRSVTAGPEWSGGLYDGKVRLPIGGATVLNPILRGVLTHEYTHVVVRDLTKGNCPSWLNEGLAEVEGRTEFNPPLALLEAAAISGNLLAFTRLEKSLLGMNSKDAQLAYQQSYSMVQFMISSYGWYKVKEILLNLGDGMDIGAAIAKVFIDYSLDYKGLVQEWQAKVLKDYQK